MRPSRWFFVPTGLNPADLGTRPVSLENIDLDFLLSENETKLEERVVTTSIFSVVVEWKYWGGFRLLEI